MKYSTQTENHFKELFPHLDLQEQWDKAHRPTLTQHRILDAKLPTPSDLALSRGGYTQSVTSDHVAFVTTNDRDETLVTVCEI